MEGQRQLSNAQSGAFDLYESGMGSTEVMLCQLRSTRRSQLHDEELLVSSNSRSGLMTTEYFNKPPT
jgi:hypothetical protein